MNPKEIRREKIHQRIHILRIRYDRCIIFSLILLSVGLAVCMGIMFQEMHLSELYLLLLTVMALFY